MKIRGVRSWLLAIRLASLVDFKRVLTSLTKTFKQSGR